MTTTVSNGTTTLTPTVVLGWNSKQQTQTQIHTIIGSSNPDITTRPTMLRSGQLQLIFTTEANANTCRTMHTVAGVLTISSTDISYGSFSYVVNGAVTVELEPTTMERWRVNVDYQEVTT